MLSAAPRAFLTLPSCSPNYMRASRIGWTHARHCSFLNYVWIGNVIWSFLLALFCCTRDIFFPTAKYNSLKCSHGTLIKQETYSMQPVEWILKPTDHIINVCTWKWYLNIILLLAKKGSTNKNKDSQKLLSLSLFITWNMIQQSKPPRPLLAL